MVLFIDDLHGPTKQLEFGAVDKRGGCAQSPAHGLQQRGDFELNQVAWLGPAD
jgi:hypothetical protein